MREIFLTVTPATLILSLLFILTIFEMLVFWDGLRSFLRKHLAACMFVVYICGFTLYLIGFYYGASANLFTASLRAAIASLEMFASHSELIEVSEKIKEEDILYMLFFAITHFLAISLTLILILEVFGKRVLSSLELNSIWVKGEGKKLYLFDGTDENSMALAASLPEKENKIILFIKGALDTDVKKFTLIDLMISGMKGMNKETKIKDSHIIHTSAPLSIIVSNKNLKIHSRILDFLKKFKDPIVFLISSDAETNADTAYELCLQMKEEGIQGKIYTGVNPDRPYSYKLATEEMIHIVNRADLKVNHLLDTTPLTGDGCGKKTLIIGFGHTGQKCLIRLAEAGFEDIDIVDRNMNSLSGHFLCLHPEVAKHEGYRYHQSDTKGNAFWAFLKEKINELCNIVVFNQVDADSYYIGIRILEYALAARKDLKNFRIYIMQSDTKSVIYAKAAVAKYQLERDVLFPFGSRAAIYDYHMLASIKQNVVPQHVAGIDIAIRLAETRFQGQKDIDGNPSVLHLLAVGMMGKTENEKIVGFLHDVVEDTGSDLEDLRVIGFSEDVIEALRLCTHEPGISYDDYVARILNSGNQTAINVKINDLNHNLSRGRLTLAKAIEDGDKDKIAKMERINAKHEKALAMFQAQAL